MYIIVQNLAKCFKKRQPHGVSDKLLSFSIRHDMYFAFWNRFRLDFVLCGMHKQNLK